MRVVKVVFMNKKARELTAERFLKQVDRRLRIYGNNRHFNKSNPLDEMIFIILSAQTESYSYVETFKELRRRFPTRQSLLSARESRIASAIKRGGLHEKKAAQLKGAFRRIFIDTGKLSLAFLSKMDNAAVEKYLTLLPGIGVKSARCIMMYSLNRQVFPVDTHIWRISRRFGLVPAFPKPSPEMEKEPEEIIPEGIRFTLQTQSHLEGEK